MEWEAETELIYVGQSSANQGVTRENDGNLRGR